MIVAEHSEMAVPNVLGPEVVGLERVEGEHAKIVEKHHKDRHPQRLQEFV